ncbi:adenylate/guanylate cyclase domain-containing protein [Lusitaniella coriacea LEGE 07157]|uniref:Adenylate/guanylate cyclase domain-containing protein n=1 Tax=Lusitaniella coriacea LEGE 07157 TaxID=945747 RepID=A0A8J7DW89_9CYAN|nr:adenylate/guanylate cyclase domain-containing protein [Lusitaniella coriacea]MBE9116302.1 adenylate/guanylate cyclase domain-containing protein [Lusitaniella coriacea LEGE 07157]
MKHPVGSSSFDRDRASNLPSATRERKDIVRIRPLNGIGKRFGFANLNALLIVVWALLGAVATGSNLGMVQRLERQIQVTFFQIRGSVPPPDEIIILAIDEESLNQGQLAAKDPQGHPDLTPIFQFPWQRKAYGDAIARLMSAGAKSVSLDILLTDPSRYGTKDDRQLQQVLQRWGDRVTLAFAHETSQNQGIQHYLVKPHPQLLPGEPSSIHPGLINFVPDSDGRIYRLATDYRDRVLRPLGFKPIPSFAEATLNAAKIDIPPNAGEEIFYYGGTGTFPTLSFWNVLDDNNWELHRKNGTFKDKIVLIGATAETLQDFKRTPFSEMMPGVEVHANAIATLMQGRGISPLLPNPPLRGLLLFCAIVGIGLFLNRKLKTPIAQLLGAIALSAVWIAISYLAFTAAGLIVPTAIPAIAIALCGISGLATGSIREQLERMRIYRTLERYVAEPIVNEILDRHADDFQSLLKGRRVKTAILFSDIRSFTTFSLTREPEQVVAQLNTYLEAMVNAILAEGGTLDKFIGDAVMAEFGSPISHGERNDALNAIRAALGMRRELVKLQQKWRETGEEILFNGIGIHYGEAIAGDIGSSKRREFAVIGDTVNVASRVEGLTGKLFVDILITEPLYELVADAVDVVDMGAHSLKGRGDKKIRLYSLVGLKGENHEIYVQVRNALRRYLDFKKRTSGSS